MFHVEQNVYDVLVIGGGHAGCEAAYVASKYVNSVALVSLKSVGLASAPCNPSIGGVGKGQVVRELDALGGLMPQLADLAGIQYRILNESKGFAVQSTRVQIDKEKYNQYAEELLYKIPNLKIILDKVLNVYKNSNGLFEISLSDSIVKAKKVVVTVGTFLNGKLHCGSDVSSGGRIDTETVASIDDIFKNIKKVKNRFKTGTPARLNKNSVDYTVLEEQPSDEKTLNFHFKNYFKGRNLNQVSCYLARTNSETLKIIRENKEKSPMYNGQIKAVGARYCPSIEDKAYRYPDKDIHHVFIEPEGLNLNTVYPSGISSSLPKEVQDKFIRSIKGLENCKIEIYGYAVEYDVVDTTSLNYKLEYKEIPGLFFAGQVNGTSGYEEAAGQGFVAGINAALSLADRSFILNRKDSYIGVMIEDLITNKRDEPYRLFTARSENRLLVREDNVIQRMYPYRKQISLFDELDLYQDEFISEFLLLSSSIDTNFIKGEDPLLTELTGKNDFINKISIKELLKQSWINPIEVLEQYLNRMGLLFNPLVIRTVAIEAKYSGYVDKSLNVLEKLNRLDSKKINLEYILNSKNISFECKQRISQISPENFGQLKRIDGLRQATLSVVASML